MRTLFCTALFVLAVASTAPAQLFHQSLDWNIIAWIPTRVGTEWDKFVMVTAAPGGVVYAVDDKGDLYWYRFTEDAQGHSVGKGLAISAVAGAATHR
jgi:hypothetical protein